MFNSKFLFLSVFAARIINIESQVSSHLPSLLVPCYNGKFSMEDKAPLTVTLLIEILRKIELNEKNNIDLRILTISLLHEIILDGILKSERISREQDAVLYRARGHQFHKYNLVTNYFATGATTLSFNESLNQDEICFLHNMLSVTIDEIRRGDEEITCNYNFLKVPIPTIELELQNWKISPCPLMKGNVITKWGAITPGHLVYGLIAAIENTNTPFSNIISEIGVSETKFLDDKADSLWVSTIAGDLAEAALNQASIDVELGVSGFWNDSTLPVNYYLANPSSDLTESSLLGGIDSIVLGNNILKWKKLLMTTRLSQIIDMYYSNKGVAYDSSIKAANRKIIFSKILEKTNLTKQVIGAATLLKEIGNYDRFLTDNDINELSTLVVNKFKEQLDDVTRPYDSIEYIDEIQLRSSLEIIIILDGSFDYYTSKKIIYSLAEAIEVSIYGSKLGIINGETGEWLSYITGHIFDLFSDIKLSENSWPTELSLHHSFETILTFYRNMMNNTCLNGIKKPVGRAIVILSNKARPDNHDLELYKIQLNALKNIFPDINILYALESSLNQFFLDLPNRYVNDSFLNIFGNPEEISTSIAKILQRIPGQCVDVYCDRSSSEMEDYLTPEVERFYEIHEEYTKRYNFDIQFVGNNYGNISICSNKTSEEICKVITVNERARFKSKDMCSGVLRCNLQFILKVENSTFSCAENECRFPNQVRVGITWIKSGTISFVNHYSVLLYFLTLFLFIFGI